MSYEPAELELKHSCILTTADGGSRFADGQIALSPRVVVEGVPAMLVGAVPSAPGVTFLRSAGFDSAPHPAPARQWVIMVRGVIEVTTSDGETRRFGPGDPLLVTDTEGLGHQTVAVGEPPFEALFIPADPAWDRTGSAEAPPSSD